jgi:hypothetical protein
MANCVETAVRELQRKDCFAKKNAGFKPYMLFAKLSDVKTWCEFGDSSAAATSAGYSELEKTLITKGDIVLNGTLKWVKVDAIEKAKIKIETKKDGNNRKTDISISVQNSLEARAWSDDIFGVRLIALVYETDESSPLLFGHSDGFFIELKKDGATDSYGEKYEDDKMIMHNFMYEPKRPFVYLGKVNGVTTPPVVPTPTVP